MKNKRKVLLICQNSEKEKIKKLAQNLGIKFLITTSLQQALNIVKSCGRKHLSGIIADFNFSLSKSSDSQDYALAIIANAVNFFLLTLIYYNQDDILLQNDLINFRSFSSNHKYLVLKTGKIEWEKAIYELNFHLSR